MRPGKLTRQKMAGLNIPETEARARLAQSDIVVVKIGTDVITNAHGQLRDTWMDHITQQVADLRKTGKRVVIVTSGARAKGNEVARRKGIPESDDKWKDAGLAHMLGQHELMTQYSSLFEKRGISVGMLLPSSSDLIGQGAVRSYTDRIMHALDNDVVVVINGNDPFAPQEWGAVQRVLSPDHEIPAEENDHLAAGTAIALKNHVSQPNVLLVNMTKANGIHERDPNLHKDARLYSILRGIPDWMIERAQGSSKGGIGGIQGKLKAAQWASDNGVPVLVLNGWIKNILIHALAENPKPFGTLVCPQQLEAGIRIGYLNIDVNLSVALSKQENVLLTRR